MDMDEAWYRVVYYGDSCTPEEGEHDLHALVCEAVCRLLDGGPEVAAIVVALTDDPSIEPYAERKRALRRQVLGGGRDAVLIYAADRLSNMRDWRQVAPDSRAACAERLGTRLEERLGLWEEDLRELTTYDPELPFLAEIETELRDLRAEGAQTG